MSCNDTRIKEKIYSMTKSNEFIKYYIILLTLTFAFSSNLFCFQIPNLYFSLYAYRLILITGVLFFTYNILYNRKLFYLSKNENFLLFVLLIWVIYAVVSYFSSYNKTYAIKEASYILIGFTTVSILLACKHFYKNFHAVFINTWIIGYLINILIGYYEFFTAMHFTNEYTHYILSKDANNMVHLSPASVWGNPNNFAVYLIISMLLLYIYIQPQNIYKFFALSLPGIFLIFITYSKINICIAISLLVLAVLTQNHIKTIIKYITNNKAVIILIIIFITYLVLFNNLIYTAVTNNSDELTSVSIRKNLLLNGLHFFSENIFFGIGPGQFQHYMENNKAVYDTAGVSSPHCGAIEILSQYGIFILLLIIINFVYLLYTVLRKYDKSVFFKILYILIVLVLISNATSGYIKSDLTWISITIPYLALDYLKAIHVKKIF